MAIALLNAGVKTYGNFTQNINVPSGADFLVLSFADDGAAAVTATLNSIALTSYATELWYYSDTASTRVFYIKMPTIGASVALETSADATNCVWSVWSGVNQTTPIIGSYEFLELGPEGTPLDTADSISSNTGEVCLQCTVGLNTIGTVTSVTATNAATIVEEDVTFGLYSFQVYKAGGSTVTLGGAPQGTGITYWSTGSILFRLNPAASFLPPEDGWDLRPSGVYVPGVKQW